MSQKHTFPMTETCAIGTRISLSVKGNGFRAGNGRGQFGGLSGRGDPVTHSRRVGLPWVLKRVRGAGGEGVGQRLRSHEALWPQAGAGWSDPEHTYGAPGSLPPADIGLHTLESLFFLEAQRG